MNFKFNENLTVDGERVDAAKLARDFPGTAARTWQAIIKGAPAFGVYRHILKDLSRNPCYAVVSALYTGGLSEMIGKDQTLKAHYGGLKAHQQA